MIMSKAQKPAFESEEEARCWMYEQVDDSCVDNYRFAFEDDAAAREQYCIAAENGCCGFFDEEITVAGRLATIGCNYGH
jgi:hypothetical protein